MKSRAATKQSSMYYKMTNYWPPRVSKHTDNSRTNSMDTFIKQGSAWLTLKGKARHLPILLKGLQNPRYMWYQGISREVVEAMAPVTFG